VPKKSVVEPLISLIYINDIVKASNFNTVFICWWYQSPYFGENPHNFRKNS